VVKSIPYIFSNYLTSTLRFYLVSIAKQKSNIFSELD